MEEITLDKIDIIKKRTGLNYGDAKLALENNNGNVVDTLIYLENNKKTFSDNFSDVGNDLLNTVKEILKKGNVNRIKIKKDNKVLVDIPVNAGIAVGAITLFSPVILAIGAVTAIASKITIEVERPDGSIEVINDLVKNSFDQTVEKAKDFVQEMNMHKTNNENNPTDTTTTTTNTTEENAEENTETSKDEDK